MSDIIQLLPDSVANQIAAGEVIQRPASVVKELVENAIDSGATEIIINIKDAGRTLVQIIDNGCGMSETDARLSFERHSTSKIERAEDLFAISTMGFRGEALASIAAIAQIELKTKKSNEELGTVINISGSEVLSQETVQCSNGSNFAVKNLFFNVPARRKFLKSNKIEFKHISGEFQRIALANPDIKFILRHNDVEVFHLPSVKIRQRIVNIFGKRINQDIIAIASATDLVELSGFIGKPENAKKTSGVQFMFVNGRFMRSPYFHKAIMLAYEKLLPPNTVPSYFVYFNIDTASIDINIHPTKTEIKFENAAAIFQIIKVTIKESLGKFNIVPSIDFDQEGSIDIPVTKKNTNIHVPSIEINPNYNPFEPNSDKVVDYNRKINSEQESDYIENWDKLYSGFENEKTSDIFSDQENVQKKTIQSNFPSSNENSTNFFQLKRKYILTSVKSGLMIIDQKRAHERILYEKYLISSEEKAGIAQQTLFPFTIQLSPIDAGILNDIIEIVKELGFTIETKNDNTFEVTGTPVDINVDPDTLIRKLIEEYKNNSSATSESLKSSLKEQLIRSLAKMSAINNGTILGKLEMTEIFNNLFACENPNYTPDGKKIINILNLTELDKLF